MHISKNVTNNKNNLSSNEIGALTITAFADYNASDASNASNASDEKESLSIDASQTVTHNIKHRHVDVSASTNSELLASLKSGEISTNEPYLLTATTQTAGRGYHGRTWQSPKGNVYLSLYYPLTVPVSGLLSLVVAYYLAQMPIIKHINQARYKASLPKIGVKWANDIGFYTPIFAPTHDGDSYLFNKLAGILIEPVWQDGRIQGVVIGVGMNVKTTPDLNSPINAPAKSQADRSTFIPLSKQVSGAQSEGLAYQAISLADLMTVNINMANTANMANVAMNKDGVPPQLPSLTELVTQITTGLYKAGQHFTQMQKTHQVGGFLNQFNEVDILKGRRIQVTQEQLQNDSMTGVAKGITSSGSLQIQPDTLPVFNHTSSKITQLYTGHISRIN